LTAHIYADTGPPHGPELALAHDERLAEQQPDDHDGHRLQVTGLAEVTGVERFAGQVDNELPRGVLTRSTSLLDSSLRSV